MDAVILKVLKSKQSELAKLEQRLGNVDDTVREKKATLERQIDLLTQAARCERDTALPQVPAPRRRVLTKQEREELFQHRAQVMRQLLTEAGGRTVHVKELAAALKRPLTTVKDYYNDQPNLRPAACFWKNGNDGAHFTWKDGYDPRHTTMTMR